MAQILVSSPLHWPMMMAADDDDVDRLIAAGYVLLSRPR
jgi:hypothetical protein